MTLGVVLPLILLALVVLVLVLIARRAARALAVVRAATAFRGEVEGLAGRLAPVVDELVRRVDLVRRHQLPADEVHETLTSAHGVIEHEREAFGAWRVPTGYADVAGQVGDDLERFARAIEMIDFGAQLVSDGTSHQRELEAQTAIKRGYLNLLHARQSLEDHVIIVVSRVEAQRARGASPA